eukprot:COSAG01_NODE_23318_length_819_cov_4.440278_1_plen_90_part_10
MVDLATIDLNTPLRDRAHTAQVQPPPLPTRLPHLFQHMLRPSLHVRAVRVRVRLLRGARELGTARRRGGRRVGGVAPRQGGQRVAAPVLH